jgi:hypothetical protein
MLAGMHACSDQIAKAWMQLWGTACNVKSMRGRNPDFCDNLIGDRIGHHRIGAVGARVDVAMAARHVAKLADIDLEDLELCRRQALAHHPIEFDAFAIALQRHISEQPKLGLGRREGQTPLPQALGRPRRPAVGRDVFGYLPEGP